MDLKINIAYFPFQVNGIKVSLPNKDGSSNIEISRSGSYVTAFSSECNIRVQFDGNHLVSVKVPRALSEKYLLSCTNLESSSSASSNTL
jgi:hypothetical protein